MATEAATAWLNEFETHLHKGNAADIQALFGDDCYWRDFVSLTWNIHTAEGREAIGEMATSVRALAPKKFAVEGDATDTNGVVEAWFTFETEVVAGHGQLRLVGGKGYTFLTTAKELKGFEEKIGPNRAMGGGRIHHQFGGICVLPRAHISAHGRT
jgi:putative flavoprotein involved in K+ transport